VPELPEVEHIRRTLQPLLIGGTVTDVKLRRRDVVRQLGRIRPHNLLLGATVRELARHGKDLAIIATDGRTLGVHLGMSGWLTWLEDDAAATKEQARMDHVHCTWRLEGQRSSGTLRFRDPRRFGGLWTFCSPDEWTRERLADRGPDALTIKPAAISTSLASSHRPIKAALLDQSVLAGVGNIYADEALFAAGVHPAMSAHRFARDADLVREFCTQLRTILRQAIRSGGSTIRTYRDANGDAGTYVHSHQVYGRSGEPCTQCACELRSVVLAQRTTVFCPQCQKRSRPAK
jgi:formamidopyrimidine-DNA glycosylase